MLLGEYPLRVESAGWLPLPGIIRTQLHECYAPDDAALIVTTFFDWCLVCYPVVEWYTMPDRLRRMGATPQEIRDFLRSSARCSLDPEGRLYLPHLFCEHAAIARDALLIGVVIKLELWSPHRWERCGGYPKQPEPMAGLKNGT
jgi:transcriptional regulator MraZ